MSSRKWVLLATVVMAAGLSACSSTKLTEPAGQAPVETRTPLAGAAGSGDASATAAAVTRSTTPQSQVATVDLAKSNAAGAGAAAPALRVVLFDFDSFAIKDEYKALVDGHARALASNRTKRMVVEGHTDERGGREYNLALGQKRADAVVKAMELLGAPAAQLEAVSFGKERPVAMGRDEAAWALNRRAELKDR